MPMVVVQTMRGILSPARKAELLDRITDLMVEIEGRGDPSFRRNVWVRIEEADPAHSMLGGVTYTAEALAARFPDAAKTAR